MNYDYTKLNTTRIIHSLYRVIFVTVLKVARQQRQQKRVQ